MMRWEYAIRGAAPYQEAVRKVEQAPHPALKHEALKSLRYGVRLRQDELRQHVDRLELEIARLATFAEEMTAKHQVRVEASPEEQEALRKADLRRLAGKL